MEMKADGWKRAFLCGVACWLAGSAQAAPNNSLFNPADYVVISNDLTMASGTLAINTQNGTNAPTLTINGGAPLNGQIVTNASKNVVMALFNFGNLALSNGVSCTVTGNLGLVLASLTNMTLASTIMMNGQTGFVVAGTPYGGAGGPGGEAGVAGTSYVSKPPSVYHGQGGTGANGYGYGGGHGNISQYGASGGGYGGVGGWGSYNPGTPSIDVGGTNYGDAILTDLYGGSGGGAGNAGLAGGGGGGGALELIAGYTLTISATATQQVNGGIAAYVGRAGGGGSGGGLILAANTLNVAGSLNAVGGSGNTTYSSGRGGGGGSGGRIALYSSTLNTNGMRWSVAGGPGVPASAATNGAAGTFHYNGDGTVGLGFPWVPAGVSIAPTISISTPVNVLQTSAGLVGNLTSLGSDSSTYVLSYWGTNSAAWGFSSNLGVKAVGYLTNNVSGLSQGTTYSFTYAASNSAGVAWAPTTNTFTTLASWPTIANTGYAVTGSTATVYGNLVSTGLASTVVYLYYGTTSGAFTFTNTVGLSSAGSVSNLLTALAPNTTYYYQFAASNSYGWGYAATNSFTSALLGSGAQTNSLWNPAAYVVLTNSLVVTSGPLTIDTGDGATRGPTLVANGVPYKGVVVPNQSNTVWMALFDFGNLVISNVSCTVTGNLGLVLASQGNLTIGASTLDLSGLTATTSAGGPGGPGAEAGSRTNAFLSNPPNGNHGFGGTGNVNNGFPGTGYGAGNAGLFTGGGGGYGGIGGQSYFSSVPPAGGTVESVSGGTNYGDNALANLYGGSGGGASASSGYGGGGGGALELIANVTLDVATDAILKVSGGAGNSTSRGGGGGSGGGMILAASILKVAGSVLANGGNGVAPNVNAGGGGGGRVAFYANVLTTNGMTALSVAGGAQSVGVGLTAAPQDNGATGTVWTSAPYTYPYAKFIIPPTIANAGIGTLGSSTADLIGSLTAGDTNITVTCYWGPVDGTNNSAGLWANTNLLGVEALGQFTNHVTGLTPGATYYFRYYATNAGGSAWAPASTPFSTTGLPVVDNANGASPVGTTSATLNGTSVSGSPTPHIWIYWGTSDQSTNKGAWSYSIDQGTPSLGAFSAPLTGLLANQTYWYRSYASNVNGDAWAPVSTNFFTIMPTLTVTPASGSVVQGPNGTTTSLTYTATLSATSAVNVTLQYATADGTATIANNGYVPLSSTLTISAGNLTAPIAVTVNGTNAYKASGTFYVNFANATNATLLTPQVSCTISNNNTTFYVRGDGLGIDSPAHGGSGWNDAFATLQCALTNVPYNTPFVINVQSSTGSQSYATCTRATYYGYYQALNIAFQGGWLNVDTAPVQSGVSAIMSPTTNEAGVFLSTRDHYQPFTLALNNFVFSNVTVGIVCSNNPSYQNNGTVLAMNNCTIYAQSHGVYLYYPRWYGTNTYSGPSTVLATNVNIVAGLGSVGDGIHVEGIWIGSTVTASGMDPATSAPRVSAIRSLTGNGVYLTAPDQSGNNDVCTALFSNLVVYGCASNGVHLDAAYYATKFLNAQATFRNCTIVDNGVNGLDMLSQTAGSWASITNCIFSGNVGQAVALNSTNSAFDCAENYNVVRTGLSVNGASQSLSANDSTSDPLLYAQGIKPYPWYVIGFKNSPAYHSGSDGRNRGAYQTEKFAIGTTLFFR